MVNAISYVAVIAALLFVKSNQRPESRSNKGALSQFRDGLAYVIKFAPIRDLIILQALLGLFAMPFVILMPAFAKDVFHGNASTLGFLSGSEGAGSVFGALFLTSRKGTKELSRWIVIGCTLFGLGLIIFGSVNYLPLPLPVVAMIGFAGILAQAGSITVIQTIVEHDKRGRVMSLVIMAFMGFNPIGCMAAGAVANVYWRRQNCCRNWAHHSCFGIHFL